MEWLSEEVKVDAVNVNQYAAVLAKSLVNDRKLVITYVHFLYHSLKKNHLSGREVNHLCASMPLVDNRRVTTQWKGVLVPANGCKWFSLMGSNPWRDQGFVELGEDYLHSGIFAGVYTPEKQHISFLKSHIGASDVPNVSPPTICSHSPRKRRSCFWIGFGTGSKRVSNIFLKERQCSIVPVMLQKA